MTWARPLPAMLALLLCLPLSAIAAEEVDYLALAAVLIRDGHYERAEVALAQIDAAAEDTDQPRLHTLWGLVHLQSARYARAAEAFGAAMASGEVDPIVPVYRAQALFQAGELRACLAAFAQARARADQLPQSFGMRAEAHWRLEERSAAWRVLTRGQALHPAHLPLLRRKLFYAIELGLYRVGAELGRAYLERSDGSAEDYLAVGSGLLRSGSVEEALPFLEIARLRFPGRRDVTAELARAYRDRGDYRSAAGLLERAAFAGDAALFAEAAELYRLAGAPHSALALNRYVLERQARLRQRLAILLDLQRYALVVTLKRALQRAGLLDEDSIRYAVAYAHFKTGDYVRSEALLAGLRDAALFRKAAELRRVMQDCRDARWQC